MMAIASIGRSGGTGVALGALCALLAAPPASARQSFLDAWLARYTETSQAGVSAECQLCHTEPRPAGRSWNAYGWDVFVALDAPACDVGPADGFVSPVEAFFCVEPLDSDLDPGANDNAREIGLGTQPGWTLGANNTIFSDAGSTPGQLPPDGIGTIDPEGTEPPPPPPPPPPDEEPIKLKKTVVVKPGQSIQAAIDRTAPGGKVLILPGVYQEPVNGINALTINKNGIRLIGNSTKKKRVILRSAEGQRNGIVVVPPMREDCMDCHTSMAPPFPLSPGVEPGMLKDDEPWLYDIEVRGITIEGFPNNGLFTEHVDGFRFVDVWSIENKNYGIFPVLSRNGVITDSRATGSDDSGIWVETSENVLVTRNLAEGNVNGFEVSNSDDILLTNNVARNNSVGAAILLLPDIFDDRPGAKRIDLKDNHIYQNNKENTATPGSILATVPKGTGVLYLGVDDSEISGNRVEGHELSGIAVVDYCLAVADSDFNCATDPNVLANPGFVDDQASSNNRVVNNEVLNNGFKGVPPFAFLAADLTDFSLAEDPTCYQDNEFGSFVSLRFFDVGLPPCE